jgi:hypothetical protein
MGFRQKPTGVAVGATVGVGVSVGVAVGGAVGVRVLVGVFVGHGVAEGSMVGRVVAVIRVSVGVSVILVTDRATGVRFPPRGDRSCPLEQAIVAARSSKIRDLDTLSFLRMINSILLF